ncbi:hypothetical protein Tco_1348587 [Tanacetum coccineum]
MANLSSFNSDVLSEVPYTEYYQPELIYDPVQKMQYSEQPHIDETPDNELTSHSNIILYSQYLLELQSTALGYQNPFYLKKAQRIRPTLYDGNVISIQHVVVLVIDDEETLILEEES